jgi:hypothetical protein
MNEVQSIMMAISNEIFDLETERISIKKDIHGFLTSLKDLNEVKDNEVIFIEKTILENPEFKNEAQRKNAIKEKVSASETIQEIELNIKEGEKKIWDLENVSLRQNQNQIEFLKRKYEIMKL